MSSKEDASLRPIVAYDPHDRKVPRAVRQRVLDQLVDKNAARATRGRPAGAFLDDEEERAWAAAAAIGEEMDLYHACEGKMAYMNLAKQYLKRGQTAREGSEGTCGASHDADVDRTRIENRARGKDEVAGDAGGVELAREGDVRRARTAEVDETTCLEAQEAFWRPFLVSEERTGHLRENIWSWDGHLKDKRHKQTSNVAEARPADRAHDDADADADGNGGETDRNAQEGAVEASVPPIAQNQHVGTQEIEKDPQDVFAEELDAFLAMKLEAFVASGRLSTASSERIARRARSKVLRAETCRSGPLRSQAKERIYALLVRYVDRETS